MSALAKLPDTGISPSRESALRRDLPPWSYEKFRHNSISGRRSGRDPDLCLSRIARTVGIHESYLGRILNGRQMPSMRIAVRLAKALETTVEDLWALLQKRGKEWRRGQEERRELEREGKVRRRGMAGARAAL